MKSYWERSWEKRAQLLYEHLDQLDEIVDELNNIWTRLSQIHHEIKEKNPTVESSARTSFLKKICDNIENEKSELNTFVLDTVEDFEEYSKPSMEKEDLLDVLEYERESY